jgi:hypothetical protein
MITPQLMSRGVTIWGGQLHSEKFLDKGFGGFDCVSDGVACLIDY